MLVCKIYYMVVMSGPYEGFRHTSQMHIVAYPAKGLYFIYFIHCLLYLLPAGWQSVDSAQQAGKATWSSACKHAKAGQRQRRAPAQSRAMNQRPRSGPADPGQVLCPGLCAGRGSPWAGSSSWPRAARGKILCGCSCGCAPISVLPLRTPRGAVSFSRQ